MSVTAQAGWLYHPEFPEAWRRYKLHDIASWINGMAFRDFHFTGAGRPIIKIAEIKNGISGQTKFTSREYDPSYLIETRDLLFSWSGQPESSIDAFWWSGPEGWLNQHIFKVNPIGDLLSKEFLFYLLRYLKPNFIGIAKNKQTTGLGHVTKADLRKIEVGVPPDGIQSQIVKLLKPLDDKIQLNAEINQTLERLAQAMFQAWFVDFRPVRAKVAARAEGRDPLRAAMSALSGKDEAALDTMPREQYEQLAATAALFPDELVDSELGSVPQGWEVTPLDKVAHYLNGLALQRFPPEDEQDRLPVIKIAQLKKGDTAGADWASAKIQPSYIVDDGDVLFSWSGSLAVDFWCGGRGALNQHLFKVTSAHHSKWFFYYWTKHHLAEFQRIAAGKAVTMGHIQRKHLTEALCLVPPRPMLNAMGGLLAPLVECQIERRKESRTLAELRDTLLPKLLSGEIRVGEAQELVEAAA